MTNRKLGRTLPAARPLWPTAPTVWTPSFLFPVVYSLVSLSPVLTPVALPGRD